MKQVRKSDFRVAADVYDVTTAPDLTKLSVPGVSTTPLPWRVFTIQSSLQTFLLWCSSCALPDLDGVGGRPTSTMEEKFEAMLTRRLAQFEVHFAAALASIPMLVQGFSRFENNIMSLTQSVASVTNNISNIEQAVGGLAARAAAWRPVRPLAFAAPTRQDLRTYSDMVTAPQPLGLSGPMAQGHLMTIGIRDVDLIYFQALKTNMHRVPSHYGSHVNNTTLGLRIGSITCGKIKHASL